MSSRSRSALSLPGILAFELREGGALAEFVALEFDFKVGKVGFFPLDRRSTFGFFGVGGEDGVGEDEDDIRGFDGVETGAVFGCGTGRWKGTIALRSHDGATEGRAADHG